MKKLLLSIILLPLLTSCNFVQKVESKARRINNYERVALHLAKQNRDLRRQINSLEYDIQQYKAKISYLQLKMDQAKTGGRKIASIGPSPLFKKDLVQFATYKWSPTELKSVAMSALKEQSYDKAAQYFYALIKYYPQHKYIDDGLLFKAGVAAYETHKYYSQAEELLSKIINDYPTSKYYRGAKLWLSLAKLKQGDKDYFFKTVEEFRKKYRNTAEWKIISRHYYEIVRKYKKM